MRWIRVGGAVVGLVLLCVSALVGVVGGNRAASAQLEQSLDARALETAGALAEYFERARAIDLLLANTPTMQGPFGGPTHDDAAAPAREVGSHAHDEPDFSAAPVLATGPRAGAVGEGDAAGVQGLLAYLEQLYPESIGEACLIDRQGVEIARVVRGVHAAPHELSHEEAENDFFGAAFALEVGEVYQSDPYVSPDTGEWVISNSTQVPSSDGPSSALMHFEVTIDSFREQAERVSDLDLMIVDRDTGRILTRTGHPQPLGGTLGLPATSISERAITDSGNRGVVVSDGERAAWRALPETPGNQNHWVVVASAPDTTAFWGTSVGQVAIAAGIGAFLLLGTSLVGIWADRRQLQHRATTDVLTGLPNRAQLHRRLAVALENRREGRHSLVMLLDLDGFKEVNDTLGHHRGDELLCEVARRIRDAVRAGDLAVRLGGDEFALVLEVPADRPEALEAAVSRLLEAIRRPYHLDGVGVHVDASIGVAIVGEHGDTPELLIQRADVAMYQAKAADVGHVVYDPGTDPHSTRRLGMTAGLLEAIERREIDLAYQPKVDVATGNIVGVEALVRWTHPTAGPLAPSEFIPMAEKTGLIRPLTECVLDEALAQCRRWLDAGRELPVAVNCSASDLVDDRLVTFIIDRLAHHEVPARMLKLELTESALMVDPERAGRYLAMLHEVGVQLAVDDYGTGYSSLTYLRRLPVSELKIDREFVAAVCEGSADALIVRSTIELGHSLGLAIVAEGVENADVLRFLHEGGCDIAQGFHMARPMAADDLVDWLDAHAAGREAPASV